MPTEEESNSQTASWKREYEQKRNASAWVEAEERGFNVRKRRVVGYIRAAGVVCLRG